MLGIKGFYKFLLLVQLSTAKLNNEQYLTYTDYALWEVIVNGDAHAITSASAGTEGLIPLKTAEQKLARKNELKAKSTLLLAIPDEHLLKSKGLDKTYDRFQKLISQLEIHENTSSTNEVVNIAHEVSIASSQGQASSLTYADDVMFSFFANQFNSPQFDNEDLEQIDTDDLEEMDLKWNQGNINEDAPRRNAPVDTSTTNALVVQDGIGGYDWSFQAEEGITNFALMAYTSQGSSSSSSSDSEVHTCSKDCLKSYETLQKCWWCCGGSWGDDGGESVVRMVLIILEMVLGGCSGDDVDECRRLRWVAGKGWPEIAGAAPGLGEKKRARDPVNTSLHTIDHEIGTRNEKERVVLERETRERIEREKEKIFLDILNNLLFQVENQDKYVVDILKKFDFSSMKTASTPIETNKALLKDEEAKDVDVHLYRSMIGSLMYLTASRPDIMFAICTCARFQVTPKVSRLHAMKRIFRYLKDQPKLGLWYLKDSPFDLEAFSDSDYARASLDRKSTTRGCQFLGKRLISWQCVMDPKSDA
ncbi:hypothetical protein Tco_0726823 [Tanacetum coccineum]|uniref:Uncharacterized protein n=1 Tax=Tanacetum coccineum TaxID=301880 RepID=A0ABQ4YJ14_9ASTR